MRLTSFIATVFLARMLEPSAFGLIAIALVLVEVAQVLTDVNVLSSRGRSKKFLQLEIAKMTIQGCNLVLGFYWGVEGYLYGLVPVSVICFLLNLIYASSEIDISVFQFIKILAIQVGVTIATVVLILQIASFSEINTYFSLIIKGSLFTLIYFGLNRVLNTQPYQCFMAEVNPIFGRLKNNLK